MTRLTVLLQQLNTDKTGQRQHRVNCSHVKDSETNILTLAELNKKNSLV